MRRFLIAVLLSGAAASPALAQDWNDHGHHQQNNGRGQPQQQSGQGHGERGNGGNYYRQQAPQFVRQQPVQVEEGQRGAWGGQRFEGRPQGQFQVQQQAYRNYRGGFNGQVAQPEQVRNWNGPRGGAFNGQVAQPEQARNWNGERNWNGARAGAFNGQVAPPQQVRNWNGTRGDNRQGQVVPQYREGNRYASNGWDRDWRNDRRYDWHRYRDNHRSLFHIGFYYDPFGYGYEPFNIGFRLAPVYFGEQYWIDPAMYELPYPPPGTQWIRYWNDAVLVDMYTGEVVDVIHDFFW